MDMNIFESLRKDHKIQRNLYDQLVQTSGEIDERISLFNQLKKELDLHANGEERYFYVPLFEYDMTQDHARHGVAEHHTLDDLVAKLEESEMSSSAWLTYAKQLKEEVYHHLDEEKHTIFQLAGKVLEADKKQSLGDEYRSYMNEER